ncbi:MULTISPECIES: hypothetical protein [unclassified Psychrobacter]|uniref:hypothetical protein n=1 Tax=unclassified Psychrobacter TaxID=196806 RepID=UPI0025B482D6|nr:MULTISPECIES: hypothetical protein [unclassified Psychrobacter]MDN3454709.1 hypothetical protein [Psychrobacter sp. APC 3350]MDN3503684.1 hypothetical protein [Psychrobacter sp. 5A.1]
MTAITVKVNNKNATITEHKVLANSGQPTVIKAADKTNYEFFDETAGRAPKNIVTKRVDKDLHASFEGESINPDLIIEGFYDTIDSAVMSVAEDGSYYYHSPNAGQMVDYTNELQGSPTQGQLTGENLKTNTWWMAANEAAGFKVMPWLAGLGTIGAGLAVAKRSDSDDSEDGTNGQNGASAYEVWERTCRQCW